MPKESLNLLEPGQRVEHAVFGTGSVLEVHPKECCYLVAFDRLETPRQISFKVKMTSVA